MTHPQIVNRTIHINASPSIIWEALIDPDTWSQWSSPHKTSIVTSDYQLGSPITFTGTWDRRKYLDKGVILAFDPEKHLSYNMWSKLSRLPDEPENYTVVDFTLTPTQSGTTLTLTHSNFQNYTIYGHANFYWPTALHRIKNLLEK